MWNLFGLRASKPPEGANHQGPASSAGKSANRFSVLSETDDKDESTPPQEADDSQISNHPQESVDKATSNTPQESADETVLNAPQESVNEATLNPPQESVSEATLHAPQESVNEATSKPPQEAADETMSNPPKEVVDENASDPPEEVLDSQVFGTPQEARSQVFGTPQEIGFQIASTPKEAIDWQLSRPSQDGKTDAELRQTWIDAGRPKCKNCGVGHWSPCNSEIVAQNKVAKGNISKIDTSRQGQSASISQRRKADVTEERPKRSPCQRCGNWHAGECRRRRCTRQPRCEGYHRPQIRCETARDILKAKLVQNNPKNVRPAKVLVADQDDFLGVEASRHAGLPTASTQWPPLSSSHSIAHQPAGPTIAQREVAQQEVVQRQVAQRPIAQPTRRPALDPFDRLFARAQSFSTAEIATQDAATYTIARQSLQAEEDSDGTSEAAPQPRKKQRRQ